jgi:hypothetical protein
MDLSEIRKVELPMQVRLAPVSNVDEKTRVIDLVWSTGAGVARFDWWTGERYIEELAMDPKSIRMERMKGGAPLLAAHNQWDLDAVIGVIETAEVVGGEGRAQVRFAEDEESDKIFRKVQQKILRNVSVGYIVHRYQKTDGENGAPPVWRAIDWEPCEVSFVAVPADAGAQVRSAIAPDLLPKIRTYACDFITPAAAAGSSSTSQRQQETTMTGQVSTAVPAAESNAGSKEPTAEQRAAIAATERERVEGIRARAIAQGLDEAFFKPLIDGGKSLDEACRAMVDEVARRKPAPAVNSTRVEITVDERATLRSLAAAALVHRVAPRSELPNGAGEFRYMSLMRLAEEVLTREGVKVRGLPASEIAARSLHSTSDFPNILVDAINKRLRQAYEENIPSYARWARRAPNAPDFKTINVTLLSGAPDLRQVLEDGEFKYGSMNDGKETYSVATYGRIIGISRQALINDDLNAFDRIPRALGGAARRLENRTVYDILSGTGTLSDTGQLFNVNAVSTAGGHANLSTGTGSVLSLTSLGSQRAAMRVQKGKAAEELNVAPAYIIGPAALEQSMYQFTSSQYVPAKPSDTNEFRQGGRTALEPIVEAYLDGTTNGTTAWYLAADTAQIDTIEYCFLDGNEGLYLENQVGFDVDGMKVKARLDFAAAAIDFRGLQKAKGA